jgi:tyrosinase
MIHVSRRSFLAGAAAIPFATWMEGHAATATPLIRYDARSPSGQAMLKIYADAVAKMKAIPPDDPRSWTFQWYTHWVNGVTTKDDEVMRIFPSPGPARNLAEEMWSTCQAHGDGEDENMFLPWHRMFVLYFESIIRNVSGVESFTLPYWNYSVNDPAIRGVIPPEFTKAGDPVYGSLYVAGRNPGVNNGQPIQAGQPGDPLSTSALGECPYEGTSTDPGFCAQLDNGLHGAVHVLVGNSENMGSIPFAANDPIFWMHHCNIDRLWASWTAAGRATPSLAGSFVFADGGGNRVVGQVGDVLDVASLGYQYDALEPTSACPSAAPALAAALPQAQRHAATAGGPIELKAQPVRVTLEPKPPADPNQPTALRDVVARMPAQRRLYLLVKGLQAQAQPNVLYHVYLELPDEADANAEKMKPYHVGAVNFFNAVRHVGPLHAPRKNEVPPAPKKERSVRFDITDLAKKLHASGALKNKPTVTIAPVGQPAASAKPVIGEISIIQE